MVRSGTKKKAFDAISQGNLEALQSLARGEARRGGNLLNIFNQYGQTLLHFAAICGHEPIIRWLLSDEGGRALGFTNVLAMDRLRCSALYYAASNGRLACCRAILEGCKVENGEREEMLNAVSVYGATVLHLTGRSPQNENIIRWLLSNEEGGARALGLKSETITALDKDSESALHKAAYGGSRSCIEALLSGCTTGERIQLFLAVSKRRGWTALHWAARCGRAGGIVELLRWEEAKMIVDARDHRGMTALHRLACDGGLDKESRDEWKGIFRRRSIEDSLTALIGLTAQGSNSAAVVLVDVNAGLEIPEEIKIAAAAAEEAKKRGASEMKEINVKRSRK